MRSDYGCIIHDLAFKSSNTNSAEVGEISLEKTIREFEPRIIVHNVKAERLDVDEGIINFIVDYEIQTTNVRDNIVFPTLMKVPISNRNSWRTSLLIF